MEELDDIVQEFLVESHENLDTLDGDLVALEQSPESRDLVSRIEFESAKLSLSDAEQRLKEVEAKILSTREIGRAHV